ncbi:hypothetical protein SVAN01_01840 [Stagonosporopsis vannaccii]|nr:hypothetical protein SVAN01_01840 [Stagonosporopsis vannaccii]
MGKRGARESRASAIERAPALSERAGALELPRCWRRSVTKVVDERVDELARNAVEGPRRRPAATEGAGSAQAARPASWQRPGQPVLNPGAASGE